MNLLHDINLPQVWLRRIRIRPTKADPKVAIDFRLWLTPTLADKLDCYEAVFDGTTPKPGVGSIRLVSKIQDCKLYLKPGLREIALNCSEIEAPVVNFTDEGPELRFTAMLVGQAALCAALADQCGVDPIALRIEPCQQSLPFDGEESSEQADDDGFESRDPDDVVAEIIPKVRKINRSKEKENT